MKLILHIGTEKTATTTLQYFLYHNRKALLEQRIALLDKLDQPCNRKMAAYCLPDEVFDDYFTDKNINSVSGKRKLFEPFLEDLRTEISKAQKKADIVIITCEHFHSRLKDTASIQKLHDLIKPYFDAIEICCYFREQSSLALSAYSTAIVAGETNDFEVFLMDATPENHYYNYDSLFTKWAEVFGRQTLRPMLYGSQHFHEGDIRRDFLRVAKENIDFDQLDFNVADRNRRLGLVGLKLAQINNILNPRYLQDGSQNKLRRAIFSAIQNSSASSLGEHLFPHASDIYCAFEESNTSFASKFLGFKGNPFSAPEASAEKKLSKIQLDLEQIQDVMAQQENDDHSLSYPDSENFRKEANKALRLNDGDKAETLFEKAITTSDNFKTYRDYSIFLQKKGDYQKAIEMCQAAIDLRPDRPWLKKLMQSIIGLSHLSNLPNDSSET